MKLFRYKELKNQPECLGHYEMQCNACKECTPNYDKDSFPNNYDCINFKEYKKQTENREEANE